MSIGDFVFCGGMILRSKRPKPIHRILQTSYKSIDERGDLSSESRKTIYIDLCVGCVRNAPAEI